MDREIYSKRKKIWEDALVLPVAPNLLESGILELSEYFSKDPEEIKRLLPEARKLLADEWHRKKINKYKEGSVVDFYNTTHLEIFELMDWHANRFHEGPLSYVCAMEIAKQHKINKYLDYGSGIGSGGVLFAKSCFDVTCADVSSPLLEFIKFRMARRKLKVKEVDLKVNKPQKDSYELITCFDVLEHTIDPLKTLKVLRSSLMDGGLLILNNATAKEDVLRPLHISQVNLEKRLRSLGFIQLWNLQDEFKKSSTTYIIVLKKVVRPAIINVLFFLYDNWLPVIFKKILKNGKI